MTTFMEIKGQNGVKYSKLCSMAPKLGQKFTDDDDDDDLYRGQTSTEDKCGIYSGIVCPTFMIFGEWVRLMAESVHAPFWVWYKLN